MAIFDISDDLKSLVRARYVLGYLVAVVLMASVAIGSHIYVASEIEHEVEAAEFVNLSGRQRMLVQRGLNLAIAASSDYRSDTITKELEQTLIQIRRSDGEIYAYTQTHPMPPEISNALNAVWDERVTGLARLLDDYIALGQSAVSAPLSDTDLWEMESLVFGVLGERLEQATSLFQTDAELMLVKLERTHLWQMILLVTILVLEAGLIFLPILHHLFKAFRAEQSAREDAQHALELQASLSGSKERFMSAIRNDFLRPLEQMDDDIDTALEGDFTIRRDLLQKVSERVKATRDRITFMAGFYDNWQADHGGQVANQSSEPRAAE